MRKYDEFSGSELDARLWTRGRPPWSEEGEDLHDPAAETRVSAGEVNVRIPRFTKREGKPPLVESLKFLMMSTGAFALDAEGPAMFAVDLAVENLGGSPGDVRRGVATFNVVNEQTGHVFDVVATSSRICAIHELLPVGREPADSFVHVVESPLVTFPTDNTQFKTCLITLDRSRGAAEWSVDGARIYFHDKAEIPERVHMAFGIFAMINEGQGLSARWRDFRYQGASPVTAGDDAGKG